MPRLPTMNPERLGAAIELVRRQSLDAPGGYAALGVARADETARTVAFLDGEPLEEPRRSAVASLTKPITATAVMQLVESAGLGLDDPVERYVPEFHPAKRSGQPSVAVTVRHLLAHTSGIRNIPDAEIVVLPPTADAMLERVCAERPRFTPGSQYAYASDAWYLLSAVVERVAGASFPVLLRERIFRPLGMEATTFDPRDPGPAPLPPGLPVGPLRVTGADAFALFASLQMPGGGLWSTPEDMLRFGLAILRGGNLDGSRVLSPDTVREMVQLQTAGVRESGSGRRAHHALGWALPGLDGDLAVSETAFGHTGATGSALIVDPANGLVVVHLRNAWGVSMAGCGEAIDAVVGALGARAGVIRR